MTCEGIMGKKLEQSSIAEDLEHNVPIPSCVYMESIHTLILNNIKYN